jgi:hypothetical protein
MKFAEIFPFLVLFLCPACEPTHYALPSNALRYASATRDDDGLRVTLTPVTQLHQTPALMARMLWRQSPLYWGVALREKENQDLILPLVPLPSLQVTIENQGREPIRFAGADIQVEDDTGHRYAIAARTEEYLPRVLDQLLAKAPDLWFLRQKWGPTDVWPAYMGWHAWNAPVMALIDAARQVPLLGREVVVQPGERWVGAIVVLDDAKSPEELVERLKGNLKVSWSGVTAGTQPIDPQQFTLALDGRADSVVCSDGQRVGSPDLCPVEGYREWRDGGPCIQLGPRNTWAAGNKLPSSLWRARWLGGTRIANSDLDQALRDLPESQKLAKRARALKAAGYTLILGGTLAAASTAAGIAGAGYTREAPAGVSLLGITGVGALLEYLAVRTEDQAIRAYNREAFKTGACSAPL